MNTTIYLISQIILFLLAVGLVAAILYALHHAFKKIGYSKEYQKKMLLYVGLGFFFWLALLGVLAGVGFFANTVNVPFRIFGIIIIPIILIALLMTSKPFKKILHAIPEHWLIYIQAFRIPMELFLWLGLIGGFVPFQMTFEGLNYDILVGITALMAGYVFFANGRYRRFEAIIWNISGITLLLNILIIAILSAPSPFRVFLNEPANVFVTHFPFIWIPGFIVPFAFATHLFSIKQLLTKQVKPKRSFLSGRRGNFS